MVTKYAILNVPLLNMVWPVASSKTRRLLDYWGAIDEEDDEYVPREKQT
jgi:hypothetical protein